MTFYPLSLLQYVPRCFLLWSTSSPPLIKSERLISSRSLLSWRLIVKNQTDRRFVDLPSTVYHLPFTIYRLPSTVFLIYHLPVFAVLPMVSTHLSSSSLVLSIRPDSTRSIIRHAHIAQHPYFTSLPILQSTFSV